MQGSGVPSAKEISAKAFDLGFDACGVAAPDEIGKASDNFREFLARDWQGDMSWMASTAERRADPLVLWPECKSVIMLGTNYTPAGDPLRLLDRRDRGSISVYAKNRDYHDVIRGRLKHLGGWLHSRSQGETKVFVDTAPVLEKPLAELAGIGWQGKHTNLVSREYGSWMFLGAVFTDVELARDAPESDHCGSCSDCLDICPTNAFPAPRQLDARRCISYLTIEHKGHIPREFREPMGNRIYGCDDCLAVCPWNKFACVTREYAFHPRMELTAPLLSHLVVLDNEDFRQIFARSPVRRLGRDRFVRNVLIAIGNSGDETAVEVILPLLGDRSALVRAMTVWALSRILEKAAFDNLRQKKVGEEEDACVQAEWNVGL